MLDLIMLTLGQLTTLTVSMCAAVGLVLIAIDSHNTLGGGR